MLAANPALFAADRKAMLAAASVYWRERLSTKERAEYRRRAVEEKAAAADAVAEARGWAQGGVGLCGMRGWAGRCGRLSAADTGRGADCASTATALSALPHPCLGVLHDWAADEDGDRTRRPRPPTRGSRRSERSCRQGGAAWTPPALCRKPFLPWKPGLQSSQHGASLDAFRFLSSDASHKLPFLPLAVALLLQSYKQSVRNILTAARVSSGPLWRAQVGPLVRAEGPPLWQARWPQGLPVRTCSLAAWLLLSGPARSQPQPCRTHSPSGLASFYRLQRQLNAKYRLLDEQQAKEQEEDEHEQEGAKHAPLAGPSKAAGKARRAGGQAKGRGGRGGRKGAAQKRLVSSDSDSELEEEGEDEAAAVAAMEKLMLATSKKVGGHSNCRRGGAHGGSMATAGNQME